MTYHQTQTVWITNGLGLHARSAAKIAHLAQKALHAIWLIHEDQQANATDILDMLALEIPTGRAVRFACEDANDIPVIQALTDLVEAGFGESSDSLPPESLNQRFEGIAVSPGVAIGPAHVVYLDHIDLVPKYRISESAIVREAARFQTAVKTTREELLRIIEGTTDELQTHTDILNTHVVMLNDRLFYGKIIDVIATERINAEWALQRVAAELRGKFSSMSDPYLQERALDIMHLSDRVMRNLSGAAQIDITGISKRVILVMRDLSPAQATQIRPEFIKGVATDTGGKTSHAGIIVRSLRIAAVMGLQSAVDRIAMDDLLILDGSGGVLIHRPDSTTLMAFLEKKIDEDRQDRAYRNRLEVRSETADGVQVPVMGNIEIPEEAKTVLEYGGEGIGLYRTEFQYLGRLDFPTEEELFTDYRYVVEQMAPHPVTIRTLDINGDKALEHGKRLIEANPAIGFRAIRYCLKNPNVFRTQIRAILRAAVFGNVRMLVPMIASHQEVLEVRKLIESCKEALESEHVPYRGDIPLGIMIEVPSAAILADILAEEVDFFSIGTNDLIQFTLAIDRGNREVAYMYSPLHPAVLRLVKHVIETGHQKGIPTFMCGEMAGDPLCLPLLVAMGIDELSMTPQSIGSIKQRIATLRKSEADVLLAQVLAMKSTEDIIERMLHSDR